jgi:hypothetical protein
MVDLREIEEVKEVDSAKEVNELLAEGWVLLNTYRKAPSGSAEQRMIYVLGREAPSPRTRGTTDVLGPSGGSVEVWGIGNGGSPGTFRPGREKPRYNKRSYSGGTVEPYFIEDEDEQGS